MMSQTVEYALRAIVHLAHISPSACTTEQIAGATKVPKAYLVKVLQSLIRGGLVHSQRGVGGGVSLKRKPSEISLLDVVNSVEPICRITECPLGISSHGTNLCPLHKRLDNAIAQVQEAFGGTTLAEILAEPTSSIPLCSSESVQPNATTLS